MENKNKEKKFKLFLLGQIKKNLTQKIFYKIPIAKTYNDEIQISPM